MQVLRALASLRVSLRRRCVCVCESVRVCVCVGLFEGLSALLAFEFQIEFEFSRRPPLVLQIAAPSSHSGKLRELGARAVPRSLLIERAQARTDSHRRTHWGAEPVLGPSAGELAAGETRQLFVFCSVCVRASESFSFSIGPLEAV